MLWKLDVCYFKHHSNYTFSTQPGNESITCAANAVIQCHTDILYQDSLNLSYFSKNIECIRETATSLLTHLGLAACNGSLNCFCVDIQLPATYLLTNRLA